MIKALIIDGQVVGFVRWTYGGDAKCIPVQVSAQPPSTAFYIDKGLGPLIYTPLEINIKMDIGGIVYDWIKDSWANGAVKRDCTIALVNPATQMTEYRWNFLDSYLSEVKIPKCVRGSRAPDYLTLTIVPERIENETGGPRVSINRLTDGNSGWSSSGFKFEIDNLPCNQVTQIESFTWNFQKPENTVGSDRYPVSTGGVMDVSDLKLTIALADIQDWNNWYQEFVNQGAGPEKSGTLHFQKGRLPVENFATIQFEKLGIFSISMESTEEKIDDDLCFQVELYCDRISFEH